MTSARRRRSTRAIQAVVGPGDEAIVFDPSYDSYDPAVRLAGGRACTFRCMPPDFRYDWDRIAASDHDAHAARSSSTRRTIRRARWHRRRISMQLAAVIRGREHLRAVGRGLRARGVRRRSARFRARAPGAAREAASRCSRSARRCMPPALRVGYCVAPPELTRELRKVHQFNTFSIATGHAARDRAVTRGEAGSLARISRRFLPGEARRVRAALEAPRSSCRRRKARTSSSSTTAPLPTADDVTFAERLLTEAGVATIPLSPFYKEPPQLARAAAVHREAGRDAR